MGRRRNIRGTAANLLSSFVSRNNDLDGYWAVGHRRSFADNVSSRSVRLDLLDGTSVPSGKESQRVGENYGSWLRRELTKNGLSLAHIREAAVFIEFGQFQGPTPPPQITRGEPFVCRVLLVDDGGRRYERAISASCDQHDARRESRRHPEKWGLGV
jgi:hypothetical protein